ncbi:MAG TPA: nucleoside transporter C-terminal domain-containing protein [Chitinophagales bacterium]|nr:nucleoside transporter C-terminal domain-containing protein [Chitinophagales bacterium]
MPALNFISLGGMIVLLLCAWLLSYQKSNISFRQIAWGIGLQFLFAAIVLKSNWVSFAGMAVLGALVINYLFKDENVLGISQRGLKFGIIMLITVFVSGMFYAAGKYGGTNTLLVIIIAVVLTLTVNAFLKLNGKLQPFFGAMLIITSIPFLVLKNWYGQLLFSAFSNKVAYFLSMSDFGASFLFGNLADSDYYFPSDSLWPGFGFQFAFKVLPTIIFFGGFMSVLYYFGIMQKLIMALSKFMRWTLRTSGAETMSCTANIFVGQTEAPLLIKPFLNEMTRSELLTVMVGGFATIAGGVMAGYIAMGIPASHLIAASVMGAPAALVLGKIIYPETERPVTAGEVKMPEINPGGNVIEAATNGIADGLKLAVNVGAMLVGFIALIAVADLILNALDVLIDGKLLHGTHYTYPVEGLSPAKGEYSGYFPGSIRTFFGNILKPIAFLMGVPWQDAAHVGNLLGIKLSLNEFVAYSQLVSYVQEGAVSERSLIISTYALCGFANFSSVGIQIGGISALAPSRKADLARLGLKAMFGGAIGSCLNATIAGMLL